MEREGGIEVVQRHDAWTVRLWWPEGAIAGGPQRVVIEATDEAPIGQVMQGIATTTLRRIDLAGARLQATEAAPATTIEPRPLERFGPAARKLLEDEGVSSSYLAAVSALYVAMLDSGETAFVPRIAQHLGRRLETIRNHLKQARRDGYLTTVKGRAGGELTQEARNIIAANGLEAPTPIR